jgi:hypothetical protein
MKALGSAVRLSWMLSVCVAGSAGAQTLPSEPISIAGGRVTVGGDVTGTFGADDPGFFDDTDYGHSALRMLRIDVSAAVKAGPHFTVLGEVRSENSQVRPYALYLRIRPWTAREFDIQVGRVPPTFGAFARRTYSGDNPLIGYPLAYQYMTTMRADALARDVDELLQKRGQGWLFGYSVGNRSFGGGVALVSAFRWDTGVQVHATSGMLSATGAVTAGTVSNPLFHDDNSGRQLAGRVELRPVAGLVAGASLARGPFLSRTAARVATGNLADGHDTQFTQTAWGADLEYSRDHYLIRFETIASAWRLPAVGQPALPSSLDALSTSIEGRYKLRPRLYVAARVDNLAFSDVTGTTATLAWDAPVSRVEVAAGYSLQRNLVLKLAYQYNKRGAGKELPEAHLPAVQLAFWF